MLDVEWVAESNHMIGVASVVDGVALSRPTHQPKDSRHFLDSYFYQMHTTPSNTVSIDCYYYPSSLINTLTD